MNILNEILLRVGSHTSQRLVKRKNYSLMFLYDNMNFVQYVLPHACNVFIRFYFL